MFLNIIIAICLTILFFKLMDEVRQYSEDKIIQSRRTPNHSMILNNLKNLTKDQNCKEIKYYYRNVIEYKDNTYNYEIMPDFKQICIVRHNSMNYDVIKVTNSEIKELLRK